MAGAIAKKKIETEQELEGQPLIHIDARVSILGNIGLSREFAQTYLQAVCQKFTSSTGNYTIAQICENLAAQRLICIGARDLQVAGTGIQKFTFPSFETINAPMTLTEPNTSFFGIVCTDIMEENTITLTTGTGTQTIDGNTFSTKVTDYYLSRSRVSGELEDISANLSVYTTPDGLDYVFGNTIAWGSSVAGEEAANTWNFHWAKANLASVSTQNSGGVYELKVLTLADHLTQGSNTSYTPQGPSFGGKFYLKRHADAVNTFTITGTTTTGNVDITNVSDTDIAKVKYNDVVSGTGVPSGAGGPPKIAAAMNARNQIRMGNITYITGTVGQAANVVTLSSGTWPSGVTTDSVITISGGGGNVVSRDSDTQVTIDNSASVSTGTSYSMSYPGKSTASGTVTITVNSVPIGHAAHDIFCQVEVSGEGLVANTTWTPVGDGAGTYATGSEDDMCIANTAQFIALLNFFDPAAASSNDLTKGGSADYTSSGKEVNETSYPDIETNPLFPSTGGTTKAAATENGAITGTQPTGLGDKDVWCGRYVSFNKDRANASGAVTDFRYVVDNAEKYFYLPAHWRGYDTGSTAVVQDPNKQYTHASKVMGGNATGEPRAEMPRQPLSGVITRVLTVDDTGGWGGNTATANIPADSSITYHNSAHGPLVNSYNMGYYYKMESNNFINQYKVTRTTVVGGNSSNPTYATSYGTSLVGPLACYYNFVRQHISGTTDVSDYTFVKACAVSLASLSNFRDPIITGAHGTDGAGTGGISDANFDGIIPKVTANTAVIEAALANAVSAFSNSNAAGTGARATHPLPAFASGNPQTVNDSQLVNFADLGDSGVGEINGPTGDHNGVAEWELTRTAMATFSTYCDQRIVEIDNRIGKPTYSGTPSSAGSAPAVKVSAIPASNTGSGHVPYGRSLFNNTNMLLGKDVDLLGAIIKDIEALGELTENVKTARNKYEIYSGRDKEY